MCIIRSEQARRFPERRIAFSLTINSLIREWYFWNEYRNQQERNIANAESIIPSIAKNSAPIVPHAAKKYVPIIKYITPHTAKRSALAPRYTAPHTAKKGTPETLHINIT